LKSLSFRIKASGYTDEERTQYRLESMSDEAAITRFLSNRDNNTIFRPRVNRSAQLHLLEDKWATHLYLSSQGIPVVTALGVYHPTFGIQAGGKPLRTARHIVELVESRLPFKLVLKPRGGRQGRNILVAEFHKNDSDETVVSSSGRTLSVDSFLASLPEDAFSDYDGGYHGWLVQEFVDQHPFMLELAPFTVNTFRVVTFMTKAGKCKLFGAVLRLGRKGGNADNWDKGGLAVAIESASGRLGKGVFKPAYGGQWLSHHPDSGAVLEGRQVPEWHQVLDLCERAAARFSGVPSIGWDVVLTPGGPAILEGNATWSLPLLQIHTQGLLTDEIRADLAAYGAHFPRRLKEGIPAVFSRFRLDWARSKGPQLVNKAVELFKGPR
jgi:hypothetical protein